MTKHGTSMGGMETSKKWQARQARRRRAEEKAWASRSGPVVVVVQAVLDDDGPLLPDLEDRAAE